MDDKREHFNREMTTRVEKKAGNTKIIFKADYDSLISRLRRIKEYGPDSSYKSDYRIIKQFDLQIVGTNYVIVKKQMDKVIAYAEEIYDIITQAHQATQHGGRQVTLKLIKEKYWNITQELVTLYIECCEHCQMKGKNISKGLNVKSLVSNHMNSRCQIDLIDMQTRQDGDFKFILVYQDHLTKYVRLRPLKSKTAKEVAQSVLDIFTDLGVPSILHSDNGREFANQIVNELIEMWPDCHLVHGKPRHAQDSVEKANQDIETRLACWMKDNSTTKWSEGLRFVQFAKNRCFHSGIGRSPYEAMFRLPARDGLKSLPIPKDILSGIRSEEELESLLENSENDGNMEEIAIMHNEILKIELQEYNNGEEIQDNINEGDVNPTCPKCIIDKKKCEYCQKVENLKGIKAQCKISQKRQAENMLQTARKKIKPGEVITEIF